MIIYFIPHIPQYSIPDFSLPFMGDSGAPATPLGGGAIYKLIGVWP